MGGLPCEAEVLDLGAGTGKLTRLLARRFARAIAVEPNDSMRSLLHEQVTHSCFVLEGSAEAIPLADESVDGVFCGDCFHWFDWRVAIPEIERVLRPRGVLVLGFHASGGDSDPPYPQAAEDALLRHLRPGVATGGSIYDSGAWREPFADSGLEPLQEEVFEHVERRDRDDMVSLALSQSICSALPDDERASFAAELLTLLPDVTYTFPVRSEIYWARLL